MTLNELFNEFILEKRLQGLSQDSIISYKNILSIFLDYIGCDVDICDLSRDIVNDYILDLMSRKLSKSTVATYIRNSRIFLTWVYDNYDLSFDPRKIKIPKSPKKNVHILNNNEIEIIFNSVITTYPWITARNKAIISLMLDSGIRQCEVSSLKRCDIDYERNLMKVTGKGSKERTVPLGNIAKAMISYYILICPYKDADNLFLDRFGNPLSRNAIRLFVYDLKKRTNIDLSSHKFRHNFATNYCVNNLRKNGSSNVFDLSILMGHESIETTKKYEHFAHEMIAVETSMSHLDNILFKNQDL